MPSALLHRCAAEALISASDSSDLNERARLFMLAAWCEQLAAEHDAAEHVNACRDGDGAGSPVAA